MSKFVDKLRNLSKASSLPMGFRSVVSESKSPAMLLIAGLSQLDAKEAEALGYGNIDAGIILSQDFDSEAVRQMVEAAGEVPLGVLLKNAGEEKVDELANLGCDFVVFHTRMPAAVLHKKEMGRLLMIEPSLNSNLVRIINGLDVDGVFLGCGEDSLVTVEHLLICQHFGELLDKPLIAILPSLVKNEVVKDLWQIGADGIVIPAAQPKETFVGLRKMIDNLPKEAKHRRTKVSAILPHYGGSMDVEEEDI
jgi:hypothetical protein